MDKALLAQVNQANAVCIAVGQKLVAIAKLQEEYEAFKKRADYLNAIRSQNIIALSLVFWIIFYIIANFAYAYSLYVKSGYNENTEFKFLPHAFPIFIIFTVVVLVVSILFAKGNSKRYMNKAKKTLDKSLVDQENLKAEITMIAKEAADIISIIPIDYRYPLATDTIYNLLLNGRADTMKEALNLYEEQLHRWKMENRYQQLLALQVKQNELLWATYKNSQYAAFASTIAAIR